MAGPIHIARLLFLTFGPRSVSLTQYYSGLIATSYLRRATKTRKIRQSPIYHERRIRQGGKKRAAGGYFKYVIGDFVELYSRSFSRFALSGPEVIERHARSRYKNRFSGVKIPPTPATLLPRPWREDRYCRVWLMAVADYWHWYTTGVGWLLAIELSC